MRILFTAWEVDPFFKFGGLGDIARSLPIALHKSKVDIRVMAPYYKAVTFPYNKKEKIHTFTMTYAKKNVRISIYKTYFPDHDIPTYFLQNKTYFDVPLPETFIVFDLAVIHILQNNILEWQPEVIHCNDHHSGLIPLFTKHLQLPYKTLFTIHNMQYQGRNSLSRVLKTGLPKAAFHIIPWEVKDKQVNLLLEGILYSDKVNTVSPTYADEILTEEYGENLNEYIDPLSNKIVGILNGIDYEVRNPTNDKYIHKHYDIKAGEHMLGLKEGKAANKAYLQKKLKFEQNPDIPLIGFIGRFEPRQKGIELIHRMVRRMNFTKYQFVILGSGKTDWEERFHWLSRFYPKNVFYEDQFNEALASQIYAGCDFIMVPSKYEPCGLIQMIAMRYGCLPIARATGGLKDSIDDNINGFLFEKYSSQNLERKVRYACKLLKEHPGHVLSMQKTAMKTDFSWTKSAKDYIEVYKELLKK